MKTSDELSSSFTWTLVLKEPPRATNISAHYTVSAQSIVLRANLTFKC